MAHFPIVPISAAMVRPAYVPTFTYSGGAYGDDVNTATANVLVDDRGVGAYTPKHQAERATLAEPDYTLATDITAPRGFIGPRDPYSKTQPAAPTISSLAPNTAAAGGPSPLSVVVTGTGFTQWTILRTGGVQSPYATYVSPTKMHLLMDPARSVAGVVAVVAVDHSVASAASNFTYT